jgi:threonine aldolase
MAFIRMDADQCAAWAASGVLFYAFGPDTVRLVTSWQTTPHDVAHALRRLDAVRGA